MVKVMTGLDPEAALDALKTHGVAVLHDPGRTLAGFVDLTDRLFDIDPYHSVATRERDAVGANGTNVATVNKGSDAMPLHRESSFLPTQPDVVTLFCEHAPSAGGQTTVCDGVALLAALPRQTRDFLSGEELVWRFVLPVERWSVIFGTRDPEAVTAKVAELMARFGPGTSYEFEIDARGNLDGTYRSPFVETTFWGDTAISTSLLYHYHRQGPFIAKHLHRVTLSTGEPVPDDVVHTVERCAEQLVEEVRWSTGDVLLVDNSRAMHGRRAIVSDDRSIVVRLGRYRRDAAAA